MAVFLLIITCRNTMTTKEAMIAAGTDFRIMPMMNGHNDSTVHTATAVTAIGIHA